MNDQLVIFQFRAEGTRQQAHSIGEKYLRRSHGETKRIDKQLRSERAMGMKRSLSHVESAT
jgi:hypothetical protein